MFAAIERKCQLTYRQSQLIRTALKAQGCHKLFEGCSDITVRSVRKNARLKVAYIVGTSTLFEKKDGSHTIEPAHVRVESFDVSFATIIAELDSAQHYCQKNFHNHGEYLICFGGDTGGRYFKFGYFITHREKANQGVKFHIVFMVEKIRESHRNLMATLKPFFVDQLYKIMGGKKSLIRACEKFIEVRRGEKKASWVYGWKFEEK